MAGAARAYRLRLEALESRVVPSGAGVPQGQFAPNPTLGRPSALPAATLFHDLAGVNAPAPTPTQAAALGLPDPAAHPGLPAPPPFYDPRWFYETQPNLYRFGADGVLHVYTPYSGWANNPLTIARYVVGCYISYQQDGDSGALAPMQTNASWLANSMQARQGLGGTTFYVIPYSFGVSDFFIPPGFVSGIAAAAEADALFSAGLVLGRADWSQDAYSLTTVFSQPVSAGGVMIPLTPDGSAAWFEEYASNLVAETPRVLNGHMLAVSWLNWYAQNASLAGPQRQAVQNYVQQGLNGLALELPNYDEPSLRISVYDLERRGWNQAYQDAHVIELDYLYHLTGRSMFEVYANRWRGKVYPPTSAGTALRFGADVNGDGNVDRMHFDTDGRWRVDLVNGDVLTPGIWAQWSSADHWNTVAVGDFNGDGKADVVGFNADGSWWVGLSSGNGFTTQLWTTWSSADHWSQVFVGDVNGDGKADVVGFNKDGAWWVGLSGGSGFTTQLWATWSTASHWANVTLADVNGDGKADLLGFNRDGAWWAGLSGGFGFTTQLWAVWSPAVYWPGIFVGDFNGDGSADVAGFSGTGTWWVGLSTGGGLGMSAWAQWSTPDHWSNIVAGNFLRHRRTDIAGFNYDGTWWIAESNGGPQFQTQVWS